MPAKVHRFCNYHVLDALKLGLSGKERQRRHRVLIGQQNFILPFSPCLIQSIHPAVLRQLIHDLVNQVLYIPLEITIDFFPACIL